MINARSETAATKPAFRDPLMSRRCLNQKQELAKGLFPNGLVFSPERKFFEPSNLEITQMYSRFLEELGAGTAPLILLQDRANRGTGTVLA